MPVQFLHIADVHLGYQQYGSRERFNDFGKVFRSAAAYAVEHQVDFVLIAGDLFHKSAVDPPTLLQAVNILGMLRKAGIQVVAVAGNHDGARYRAAASWLDFLAETEYLVLLSPAHSKEGLNLQPWDGHDGAYLDIGSVRIFGLPYLGASTNVILADFPRAIADIHRPDVAYTILVAHAGIEGEMPRIAGGLTQNELVPLRPHVNYLALGHLHKPFEREDWIYNPGSLEVCGMDEARWRGGYYHVQVELSNQPVHTAQHIKNQRRPFHRISFQVDGHQTPATLYDALRQEVEGKKTSIAKGEQAPVVEVSLEGVLGFDRAELNLAYIREFVDERLSPLIPSRVHNHTRPTEFDIAPDDGLSRKELEETVFRELVLRDSRYRRHAKGWAALMTEVKSMALSNTSAETISATIRRELESLNGAAMEEE